MHLEIKVRVVVLLQSSMNVHLIQLLLELGTDSLSLLFITILIVNELLLQIDAYNDRIQAIHLAKCVLPVVV